MKKSLLTLITLLIVQISSAQVGIGTSNPNASASLDISSANSGLLIPRVALTSTTVAAPITTPATSLLVYNSNTAGDVTPGFYYWEGSWKTLKGTTTSSSSSGWNLTGNTLSSGSEFLGTISYHPLVFKVNNTQFARFHPNGGMAFGNGAVASDTNSVAIGTGATTTTNNEAVAIGPSSKASYQSVSIGLNASTAANTSIAIGSSAKVYQQNGISIGTTTESNQDATAVGFNSKATGFQSSAYGNGTSATGQNSTVIGNGATTSQANAIILGTTTNKTGIGTSTPDERLHIAGSIKIVDGTQNNNFVLTSDATGKATWKDPNSSKAFGEIYKTTTTALNTGAINFGTNGVSLNVTLSGDNIQVQTTGIYRITYSVAVQKNDAPKITAEFFLTIYGAEIAGTRTYASIGNNDTRTVTISKLVSLNAYQAVSVHSNMTNSDATILANGTTLMVELVK